MLKLADLYEETQVCHVGGQSTSAKHVSGDFYATEFALGTVSRLWRWCTLAGCPEMAQTVLQFNFRSCVQDMSQGKPLCALMFHQLVCDRSGR